MDGEGVRPVIFTDSVAKGQERQNVSLADSAAIQTVGVVAPLVRLSLLLRAAVER